MTPVPSYPPPPWLLPCLHVLLGVSVVYRTRSLALIAMAFSVYWFVQYALSPPAGEFFPLYNLGAQLFSYAVRTLNGLLIQSPHDFTLSSTSSTNGQSNRQQSISTRPRLLKTLEIGFAARGVGWRYRVKNVPEAKPSNYSHLTFVAENLFGFCWRFIVLDVGDAYFRSTRTGSSGTTSLTMYFRLCRGALMFLMARFTIDMIYRLVAAVAVSLRLYSPADWPPMMGRKRDAYTVRRFWSHTWHQMMRNVAEPPVHALARALHIPKGSYLSNYFKVFGAFFVAYALHGYGTHLGGGTQGADWNFFMSQAVAIWVEETAVRLFKRSGLSVRPSLAKLVGYIWTALFIATSVMLWFEQYATFGAFTNPPFGFSIVDSSKPFLDRWPNIIGMKLKLVEAL